MLGKHSAKAQNTNADTIPKKKSRPAVEDVVGNIPIGHRLRQARVARAREQLDFVRHVAAHVGEEVEGRGGRCRANALI